MGFLTTITIYNDSADSEWSINQFICEMEYHLLRLKKLRGY